jgi:hypothetical protein
MLEQAEKLKAADYQAGGIMPDFNNIRRKFGIKLQWQR